jgi:dipeptidyl aminopeptidase/acylaminoacyl peptidase
VLHADHRRGKILEIGPVTHVSPDDPPTLIIHGDKEFLGPIQQAEPVLDKLKAAGVETKLVVKKGAGRGWPDWHKDMATIGDWFDAQLKSHKSSGDSSLSVR